jgi:hypothetical protein
LTYQNPSYSFLHIGADAGVGSLTASPVAATGFPLDNLVDYRSSSLFKFSATGAGYVEIDAGVQPMAEEIDRIIIPAGHNLATVTQARVITSTTGAYGGEETIRRTWDQSAQSDPDGIIDQTFTTTSTDQYTRFYINAPAGTAWEFGQLWITNKRTPTRGPDPDWSEQQVSNTVSVPFPSRTATVSLAANRWEYEFTYHYLDGTDLAIFDDLIEEVGIDLVPFYLDPPDDTTPTGPLLMKINSGSYRRDQERTIPSGALGAAYQIRFSMLEEIG